MTPERIDHLARRMVIDLMLEASERYWLRRAGDFAEVGTPSCDEISRACQSKARFCREESEQEWAELLALEVGNVA